MEEVKLGSVIVYKGKGLVYSILGRLLRLFEPSWDGWGWHTGVIVASNSSNDDWKWRVLESTASGVRSVLLPNSQGYIQGFRAYNWLDIFDQQKADEFVEKHKGEPYDIAVYFWTTIAVIIRHYWNRPIPKLLDRRFSCWELVQEFTTALGKPIISPYDVVIITDIIRTLRSNIPT